MKSFISLEEAIEILNQNIESLGEEEVSLIEAVRSQIRDPQCNVMGD